MVARRAHNPEVLGSIPSFGKHQHNQLEWLELITLPKVRVLILVNYFIYLFIYLLYLFIKFYYLYIIYMFYYRL